MKSNIFIGWDIGGANTKFCVFNQHFNIIDVKCKNINIWNDFDNIKSIFNEVSKKYKNYNISNFITITAESCDNFDNRFSAMQSILKNCNLHIAGKKVFYTNSDKYLYYDDAIANPAKLFSTNWMLTAKFVNNLTNINLAIDIGSTTTDLVYKNMNLENNINDHKRLINNTLFYAGVVRTPIAMLVDKLEFMSKEVSVVNEVFSTTGDVFNLTNDIDFSDLEYVGSDKLDYTAENSYKRLARSIGLDYKEDMKQEIIKISCSIKEKFIDIIFEKINFLLGNNLEKITLTSIGEGGFLIKDLSEKYSLNYLSIESENIILNNNIDKNILYKHFTAALVVKNFFEDKNIIL